MNWIYIARQPGEFFLVSPTEATPGKGDLTGSLVNEAIGEWYCSVIFYLQRGPRLFLARRYALNSFSKSRTVPLR
jgi:hypothetical protein